MNNFVDENANEGDILEIPINKIQQFDNVRTRYNKTKLNELMISIKQDGLLQPIGVATDHKKYFIIYGNRRFEACKKLGWSTIQAKIFYDIDIKDVLVKNTIENIHRENISATEEGRIYYNLIKSYDMTYSEIAARFGVSKKHVLETLRLFKNVPEEFANKVEFFDLGNTSRKGKIPASIASKIISLRAVHNLNKEQLYELFTLAKKEEITRQRLETIGKFMRFGCNLETALKKAEEYTAITISIPLKIKDYKKLTKSSRRSFNQLIIDALNNKKQISFDVGLNGE